MRKTIFALVLSLLGADAFAGVSFSINVPGVHFETDSLVLPVPVPVYRSRHRAVYVDEDSDDREVVYYRRRPLACADSNAFGSYPDGGGCNPFGCWAPGGSCNPFGCAKVGQCSATSCRAKTPSYQCSDY